MISLVGRKEILSIYRQLFRTAESTFDTDHVTLSAAFIKIRQEFKKNKSVTNENAIREHFATATSAEQYLREHIVQAELTSNNRFKLKLTEQHILTSDKIPIFNPDECYRPFS